MHRFHRGRLALALSLALLAAACTAERGEWVLPDPAAVSAWYGSDAVATIDGNLLEIRGTMDPEFLRRGGSLWARSGPYFYLFNVHVQQLLQDYPDLAGVRATVTDEEGEEIASAMITRADLNEFRWREALARASLAQRDGTRNPRTVERLILFGEEHAADFSYGGSTN